MTMMLSSVYLFNAFCALVPCSGTQPPPEAYIEEFSGNRNFNINTIRPPVRIVTQQPPSQELGTGNGIRELQFNIDPEELVSNSRRKRLGSHEVHQRRRNKYLSRRTYPKEFYGRPSRMTMTNEEDPPRSRSRPQTIMADLGGNSLNPSSRLNSLFPSLFSAVPVIPVLINNINNIMRSVNDNSRGDGGGLMGRLFLENRSGFGNRMSYEPPLVETKGGNVEGYFMGTMKGRKISAFEGIPYAEPPLGERRFKPPVPKSRWDEILMAKKPGSQCLQAHPLDFFRVTGSEDCLFLNVYTPVQVGDISQPLPVIFLIHGGSFQYGTSSEYGPSYLLDEDVILVTANYRLGPLGFLSTGDELSPGNYGLKDQSLALKWVNENIMEFGGDPSKVTIMGQSAGGVSAHLHLITNKTTSYFNNGVSLSGSSFGFWPIISRRRSLEMTQRLAKVLNCRPRSTSEEIMSCLRRTGAPWLTAAQQQLYEWIPFHPLVLFGPTIEKEGPDAFLTKRPEEAYEKNEVMAKPWIFGQTSQEGHFDIYFMKLMMQSATIALNGRKYLPIVLDYGYFTRKPYTTEVTNKILKFYGGSMMGNGVDMNYISDMYTDRYYTSTIRRAINAHLKIAPTYAYVFDFKGKYNLGSLFGAQESDWGVSHTEDMFYYFNSSVYHHGLKRNDPEYGLSQIMTDMLVNFARKGEPMHESTEKAEEISFWEPVLPKNTTSNNQPLQYLSIRRDISMISDPFKRRVAFWDSLNIPEMT